MSKYHDDRTRASDPGGITLSSRKIKNFKQQLSFFERLVLPIKCSNDYLNEHLQLGDSRAAIVVSISPTLIIAAYTDELDCVALLNFPKEFVSAYRLSEKSKLLTVNTYRYGLRIASDLVAGDKDYNRYANFFPVIADFTSDDLSQIAHRKSAIDLEEWDRTWEQGIIALHSGISLRNGSPYRSDKITKGNPVSRD